MSNLNTPSSQPHGADLGAVLDTPSSTLRVTEKLGLGPEAASQLEGGASVPVEYFGRMIQDEVIRIASAHGGQTPFVLETAMPDGHSLVVVELPDGKGGNTVCIQARQILGPLSNGTVLMS